MTITSSIIKLDVVKNVMQTIEEAQSCKNNTIADMLEEGLQGM